MQWILVALGVLVLGGFVALVTGRLPRLSTFCGSLSGVAGCAIGLVGVLQILRGEVENSLHWTWDVPYGSFSLELDSLSAFFSLPVLVLSGLAAVYGGQYMAAFWGRRPVGGVWFFFNLLIAGMLVVVLARNGVLFLVAWEAMSLSAYFLITYEDEKEEVREAGKIFLIATHLGTAFLLVMFILMGTANGSLEFADFAATRTSGLTSLLFVLALIGFGTKAGLMPLHVWLPESYPVAPCFVTAVMSGAMSKLGIYGLLRVFTFLAEPQAWWGWLLIGLGAVSGVLGILWALAQGDLKKLLAYSSIENIGIITMGVGLGIVGVTNHSPLWTILGFSGALFHVLNHSIFKGLLFLAAGAVWQATDTRELDKLGGLLKRMPWTGTAFLIGSAAIAGLPPLNGFASEFLLYSASFGADGLLGGPPMAIAALAVIGTLALIGGLAAYTFVKACGIGFLGEPRTPQAAAARGPAARMTVPILLLAGACIVVSLVSPRVVHALLPVVAEIAHEPSEQISAQAFPALEPLQYVAAMSSGLILLMATLALIRRVLLLGREVTTSSTWGCGYSRSTARIQYTASSFAQPALDFFTPLFRSQQMLDAPVGLFPQSASLRTENTDLTHDFIYRPMFGSIGWGLSKLRWLQHGRVHIYVLYVGCTILALMIWYASVELAPVEPVEVTPSAQPVTQIQPSVTSQARN